MEKLVKTSGMPIVEIGMEGNVFDDEQAIECLREASGIAGLKPSAIRSMADLGMYVRGVGVLRKQRGEVVVTQAWLNSALQILSERLVEEHARGKQARQSVIRGYAHGLKELIEAKTSSQHLALELEKVAAPTGKPDDVERPRNQAFGPGPVIAANEIHVHASPSPSDKPPSVVG